jgi:hypothetical protein
MEKLYLNINTLYFIEIIQKISSLKLEIEQVLGFIWIKFIKSKCILFFQKIYSNFQN